MGCVRQRDSGETGRNHGLHKEMEEQAQRGRATYVPEEHRSLHSLLGCEMDGSTTDTSRTDNMGHAALPPVLLPFDVVNQCEQIC